MFFKKKDDKGPDKAEEEKKEDEEKKDEAEEEVAEDEDDDSMEDAAVEDEDDPSLFPLEAQEWARNTLGDAGFAKYYQIAKHRTDSDAVEMLTKRKWRVRIKNLHFLNMDKEHDIFLRFSFGTDFRVSRRFVRQKGQVTGAAPTPAQAKNKAGPGGKPPAVVKQFEWQVKGDVGVVKLTTVKRGVEKGAAVDFDDEFTFGWRGSYFDLFKKKLHCEVWDWNFTAPNEYVASYERTLREICRDPMDQEWTIFNQIRKRGKVENVNVGTLRFTVIVEEVLEYTVKLSNWQCTLDVVQFMQLEDESKEIVPFAVFNLHYPIHAFGSKQRVVSKGVKMVVHDKMKWIKVSFGQLKEMTFSGTRLQLEDGELFVSVYDSTRGSNTSSFSKPLAHCVIPLKAVMEIGVLSSEITKTVQTNGGGLSKLALFLGPQTKTAFSVVNGFAQSVKQSTKKALVQLTGRINAPKANERPPRLMIEAAQCGFIRGNLDVEVQPKRSLLDLVCGFPEIKYSLWREFAQVGEPNPPELRDYPPYYQTYLCVRIISARDLFPADDTGFSDPYVIVKWGDQELKTRIVRGTLRPDFLEDLIFLVRSNDPKNIKCEDLAKNPAIHISVMDFDPAGSSDMLGHCKVYLHQITGCGPVNSTPSPEDDDSEDGRRIPTRPVSSVNIRRRINPAAPLRPTTIQTRVFKSELKLQDLPPDYKSTISVECYFRTWEGDIKERDNNIRKLTHTDLVVLPPTKQLFLEKNAPCLCHPVFTFERKASEALKISAETWTLRRVMCEASRPPCRPSSDQAISVETEAAQKRCTTIVNFSKLLGQEYSLPSRSELYRMEMEQDPPRDPRKRATGPSNRKLDTCKDPNQREIPLTQFLQDLGCEDFLAKDIFGRPHWLPQYLYPLTPPKSMIPDAERKYMVIVSSKLPNAQYAAAQMVKGIEFWDQNDYHMDHFSPEAWVDPGTLLSMKKADLKSHAMLLCNLFLGLQTDAYVCMGYARTEPSQLDITELREKAREDHWPSKKFRVELEKLRGLPKPYVWVMTRESSGEEYGEAFKNVGSVKFWDVTQGGYYAPLPARWKGQNDEELFKIFKSTKAKRHAQMPAADAREAKPGGDEEEEGMASGGGPVMSADLKERRTRLGVTSPVVREEDLLMGDEILGDVQVGAEEVFGLGMMMAAGQAQGHQPLPVLSVDSPQTSTTGNVGGGGKSTRKDLKVTSPTAGSASIAAQDKPDTSLLALQSSGWAARFKQILSERQANCDELLRESLPFTEIVCIFNHKNLWVNAQRYLNPADITYDLGADSPGWLAVLTKDASEHIVPFYPPKTLGPKLTEDKSSELRTAVEDELESGLTNFRSSKSIGTRFAGREMKKLIRKYLEVTHQFESLDFSNLNGWENGEFTAGSVGFELKLMKDRLLETLANTVPPGFTFRFGTAYFHSSDPTDIRKQILGHSWRVTDPDWVKETVEGKDRDPVYAHENRRKAMHEENHDGREVFSVAANVFAYYAQIIVVRVAVIVIFPMTAMD